MPLRLWQVPFSTNVERVALALAHKGLDAEPVVVDAADRSTVRHRSGQDLVPVLEDGDLILPGSLAIVAHLEERFPEAPLYPAEPARRAEAEAFLDWFDLVWKGPPNWLSDAVEAGRDPQEAELRSWGKTLRTSLDRFESLLNGRNFLFGASFGVVDLAVFPFLKYGVFVNDEDDEQFHRILVEHLRPERRHQRLRTWIERVEALPRAGIAPEGAQEAKSQS
jgi:glutathione S-transferase